MHILFVDDDADDFEAFHEAFCEVNPDGHVIHKMDCPAALKFLRSPSVPLPDYIFMDVNMPIMTGLECLRELKADERLKNIPVIMFSTSIRPYEKEKYRKLGAADSFQKPAGFTEMKSMIKTLGK